MQILFNVRNLQHIISQHEFFFPIFNLKNFSWCKVIQQKKVWLIYLCIICTDYKNTILFTCIPQRKIVVGYYGKQYNCLNWYRLSLTITFVENAYIKRISHQFPVFAGFETFLNVVKSRWVNIECATFKSRQYLQWVRFKQFHILSF